MDLSAIVDGESETGLPHGALLVRFAECLVRRDPSLDAVRAELLEAVGPGGLIDAAGSAANFQRMVRIADGCGIPLDDPSRSEGLRAELGINGFGSAANTLG